jgi:hypothetical protein
MIETEHKINAMEHNVVQKWESLQARRYLEAHGVTEDNIKMNILDGAEPYIGSQKMINY